MLIIYVHFIYPIQNCISDNSNEAVRDFSAKCIMEFIRWTLKENNLEDKPSISLRIIIKKIEQFCIHPDLNKRLGKFK